MDVKSIQIEKEHFSELRDKTSHNSEVAALYDRLLRETGDTAFFNRAASIRVCSQWWDTMYFRIQQVKDIQRVNLCKDKFCRNCQSMLAIKRQAKFSPILDELQPRYEICHVVFTVSNVFGDELLPTLDKMYKNFKHLTRFLSGNAHIRGIDFLPYGYAGGLRALEVTQNLYDKRFHPHFHVMLLLKKGIDFERKFINSFSFDEGVLVRKFSEFEILLQKIWYLLMNGISVTKEKITQLKEGYSVTLDKAAKGEYHEVFKYACKGAFKEDGSLLDEETFPMLFFALHSRRMIQGYGVLHNYKDDSLEILEEDLTQNYNSIVAKLKAFEEPIFHIESLEEILGDKTCSYISKSNLKRLMIERKRQEGEGVKE